MKKGDDFFRITFRRNEDVIRRFEENISKLCGGGISRPLLIATICNYFIENDFSVVWKNGEWEILSPDGDYKQSISYHKSNQSLIDSMALDKSDIISKDDSTITSSSNNTSRVNDEKVSLLSSIEDDNLVIMQDDENEEMLRSMGLA